MKIYINFLNLFLILIILNNYILIYFFLIYNLINNQGI